MNILYIAFTYIYIYNFFIFFAIIQFQIRFFDSAKFRINLTKILFYNSHDDRRREL